MKNTIPFPEHIGDLIVRWLAADYELASSSRLISEVKEFYHSLKLPHDSKRPFYRGLTISPEGFVKFMWKQKLELRHKKIESWSCDKFISYGFALRDRFGIVLERSIPQKKLIMNFIELFRYYEDAYDKRDFDILGYDSKSALDSISRLSYECELLTDSVCTSCTIDEVSAIAFPWWHDRSRDEVTINFLKSLKNRDNYVDNFIDYIETYDNDSWKKGEYRDKFILNRKRGKWSVASGDRYSRIIKIFYN